MSRAKLIERLASERARKRGSPAPGVWAALWICVSLLLMFGALNFWFSIRSAQLAERGVWAALNLAALAAVVVFASFAGFVSALPGRGKPERALWGLRLALAAFVLTLVPFAAQASWSEGLAFHPGLKCSGALTALALGPGLLLYLAIGRLAPLKPGSTALLLGLAMGAAGAFALAFDCANTNPVHLLAYHGLPIIALGLLSAALGSRLLRW